jgi:hypothetical protein
MVKSDRREMEKKREENARVTKELHEQADKSISKTEHVAYYCT